MMEFYGEARHTGQKIHICEMCGGTIQIGEQYYEEKGKWNGDFFSRKLHVHCHNMEREFCEEVDNEFCWEEILDYIQDKYCSNCEHAACNDDREDWTECDYRTTECPRVIKMFSEVERDEN